MQFSPSSVYGRDPSKGLNVIIKGFIIVLHCSGSTHMGLGPISYWVSAQCARINSGISRFYYVKYSVQYSKSCMRYVVSNVYSVVCLGLARRQTRSGA